MPTPDELRSAVEDFIEATATSPTRFGLEAVGDPNFVRNLTAGREPRSRVVNRVLAFMRQRRAALETADA
jgi:hypothetical protein